jgi:truncated hemoglobin YjbI
MDEAPSVACEQLSPETWPVVAGMTNVALGEHAFFDAAPNTLYAECGGIEVFREAMERFATAAARRPAISRLLPHRELDWLRVRLLQLLVHAAGAPLPYPGPGLHAMYQQHGIPALMADQMDELLLQALSSAHIGRFEARSILNAAKQWRRGGL